MRSTPRRWLRAAPLALLVGSGALAANDKGATQADLPFTKLANLSPQETLAQSKEYVSKMQDTQRRVVQLQEVAKKQKDIIKLNCVNDKLLQVKGHLAVNDQAMSSLNEAIAKNDDATRQHEFTRVTILFQKVAILVINYCWTCKVSIRPVLDIRLAMKRQFISSKAKIDSHIMMRY